MPEMAILQFQIIQTDYEKFDVYMVVDDEEDIPEVQMLFKKLCDKDQIRGEFTFSFVDYLYQAKKNREISLVLRRRITIEMRKLMEVKSKNCNFFVF